MGSYHRVVRGEHEGPESHIGIHRAAAWAHLCVRGGRILKEVPSKTELLKSLKEAAGSFGELQNHCQYVKMRFILYGVRLLETFYTFAALLDILTRKGFCVEGWPRFPRAL